MSEAGRRLKHTGRLNMRIESKLKTEFQEAVNVAGMKSSKVIRLFMAAFVLHVIQNGGSVTLPLRFRF